MSRRVLGVDGGGTGCRAVLADGDGAELARVTGGPAVADGNPEGSAVRQVVSLCRQALDEAGVEPPVDALWAGLAGAGRAAIRRGVEQGLQAAHLARATRVGTDVDAAFHAAFQRGPGILLLAGTGSVAVGRTRRPRAGRTGGWGPVLGDEGSGYDLARRGLRAVLQAEDGRGPPTRLREALTTELGLEAERAPDGLGQEIVAWMADASRREVAALAPTVVAVAHLGDSAASAILGGAVDALVAHVTALEGGLGPWSEPPRVALAGGLLAPGGPLSEAVARALMDAGFSVLGGSPDAALGAAQLAAEMSADEDREGG